MASNKAGGGVGCLAFFAVGLFLLFLGLKLGEVGVVATWSWWWVTAPIWGYIGLFGLAVLWVFAAFITVAVLKPND